MSGVELMGCELTRTDSSPAASHVQSYRVKDFDDLSEGLAECIHDNKFLISVGHL